jgi:hypothetical protein
VNGSDDHLIFVFQSPSSIASIHGTWLPIGSRTNIHMSTLSFHNIIFALIITSLEELTPLCAKDAPHSKIHVPVPGRRRKYKNLYLVYSIATYLPLGSLSGVYCHVNEISLLNYMLIHQPRWLGTHSGISRP